MEVIIENAGYGVYNKTVNVTDYVQRLYNDGQRVFLAKNELWGDPAPGEKKYLYIFWNKKGGTYSAITGERDNLGIIIP